MPQAGDIAAPASSASTDLRRSCRESIGRCDGAFCVAMLNIWRLTYNNSNALIG